MRIFSNLMIQFVSAWVLLLACAASAQTTSGTTDAPRYSVTGTVMNSVTGEPVRRALVQIYLGAEQSMLTDGSGHFEFTDLPPGQTTVRVHKPGFFTDQDINPTEAGPLLIQAGPNAPPIVLKLIPEAVISGRVQNRYGEGIENMQVRVIYFHIMNGHRQWEQLGNTTTDDDGEFRVGKLMPGWYYVVAGPSSDPVFLGNPGSKGRDAAFPEVFYPGVRDLNSATPIQLGPGQQIEANFAVSAEPVFRVSGSVPAGSEQGMNIEFTTESGTPVAAPTEYGPGGTFKTKIPAGSYILKANVFGQGLPMTGSLNLTVNSDLTDVRVPLGPVPTIPVRIVFQSTRSNRPRNSQGPNTIMVHLSSVGSAISSRDGWLSLGGSPDPAANSIHDVEPGRYSLEITSPNPEWYVRSAQCGGTDLLREDLTVAPGARVPEIEVVLRDDGAGLTGTAMSGGSPSRAAVIAVPDAAPRMAKLVLTGPDGRFTFDKVAPGDYSIIAVDHPEGLEYSNPEALGPYLSSAVHVTLVPNGQANVDANVVGIGKS